MDILDDMGVSKLSAKVFKKVNYSFKLFGYRHSSKDLLLCSTEERILYRFGTGW